jgi:hypothetical protein
MACARACIQKREKEEEEKPLYGSQEPDGGMAGSEKLRCNICEQEIAMDRAREHASSPLHAERKERLEKELDAAREKQRMDDEDTSVAGRWAGGL